MGFVAPLFLLAALAAGLPFWLHRLRVQSADRRPFGSAMFLETTEEQVHVRKKLSYLVLLALRVAVLLLLAIAFARPFLERQAAAFTAPAATHLIVLDTSASMQRTGVFAEARRAALEALDAVPPGAAVQVMTADGTIEMLSEASPERASHRAALEAASPGPLRLDLGRMMSALERVARNLPPPVELHFVSDFQASGMPVHFRDLVANGIAALHPHRITAGPAGNRRIAGIESSAGSVTVTVGRDAATVGPARLRLTLGDLTVGTRDVDDAATTTVAFGNLDPEPGDNRVVARLQTADALPADDAWYHVLENTPPAPIPLIAASAAKPGVTYLDAALRADARSGYRAEIMIVGEAEFRTLSRYRWAIVEDLGAIDAATAGPIEAFVEAGGNLLAFAGERAAALDTLPIAGNAVRPAATGRSDGGFLTVSPVDASHPVLAGTRGWHAVNVSRSLAIEPRPDDEILLRLDDGSPFLLEQRRGRGRVLVFATGLDSAWTDLPARPVFVGFMVEAAHYLSGSRRVARAYLAGEVLPLTATGGLSGQVVDPAGDTVLSLSDTTRAQQVRLEQPGFYEVYTPGEEYLVAVNVDPRESRNEAMAPATLDRWVGAIGDERGRAEPAGADGAPLTVDLWPAALLLLALLLIAESIAGDVYLRPRAGR